VSFEDLAQLYRQTVTLGPPVARTSLTLSLARMKPFKRVVERTLDSGRAHDVMIPTAKYALHWRAPEPRSPSRCGVDYEARLERARSLARSSEYPIIARRRRIQTNVFTATCRVCRVARCWNSADNSMSMCVYIRERFASRPVVNAS